MPCLRPPLRAAHNSAMSPSDVARAFRLAAHAGRPEGLLSAALLSAALLASACSADRADREYLAALDGEEKGMTREEQIAHLDRAILLSPRRASYYETRAIYRTDLRQFDRALGDLDRVIALHDRPYARFLRGLVTCQAGDFARGLADFDTAIARQPGNHQFYRGRSLARAAIGDAPGALADAEHLAATLPQRGESYYARGVALALLGRDREALADFERGLGMRPDLVYIADARVAALERLGDRRAVLAREELERKRYEREGCNACLDPFRY